MPPPANPPREGLLMMAGAEEFRPPNVLLPQDGVSNRPVPGRLPVCADRPELQAPEPEERAIGVL
jgi:hypothetical protein